MKDKLYSILIHGNANCSLLWCDEHWYETSSGKNFVFTEEQVGAIKKLLPNHYILNAVIEDNEGNTENWSAYSAPINTKEVELTLSI